MPHLFLPRTSVWANQATAYTATHLARATPMKTAWGWSAKLTRTIVHPEPAKCTRVVSLRPSTITSDVSSRQTKNLEGLRNPASPPQGGGVSSAPFKCPDSAHYACPRKRARGRDHRQRRPSSGACRVPPPHRHARGRRLRRDARERCPASCGGRPRGASTRLSTQRRRSLPVAAAALAATERRVRASRFAGIKPRREARSGGQRRSSEPERDVPGRCANALIQDGGTSTPGFASVA